MTALKSPVAALLDQMRTPARLPRRQGPGTPHQQRLAEAVNERVAEIKPEVSRPIIHDAEIAQLAQKVDLKPDDVRAVGMLAERFGEMTDEQRGQVVGRANAAFTRYIRDSKLPSAALLELAFDVFQAGLVGSLRGGPTQAYRAMVRAHARFDFYLGLSIHGEIGLHRVEWEQDMEAMRVEITHDTLAAARVIREERLALEKERADLQVTFDNLTHAADTAQAEASAARRERDQFEAETKATRQAMNKLQYDTDKRVRKVEADLAGLPALVAERDELLGRVRWLTADLSAKEGQLARREAALQARITELETEVEEMKSKPAAVAVTAAPSASPSPRARTRNEPKEPSTTLMKHSWVVWLLAQGRTASMEGLTVRNDVGDSERGDLLTRWEAEIPNEAAALAQLRAVIMRLCRGLAA